jgi:hypothetical protein
MAENIIDILNSELVTEVNNYSTSQIWEKRDWLTGSMSHAETGDEYVRLNVQDTSIGEVVYNTGIDSPPIEVKPRPIKTMKVPLAHVYKRETISARDVNLINKIYRQQLAGLTSVPKEEAYKTVVDWAAGMHDNVVVKYIAACNMGAGQALSNPAGWIIRNQANQEEFEYLPGIKYSKTALLARFANENPESVLMGLLLSPAYNQNQRPNAIGIGEAVKDAILNSTWWNDKSKPVPSPVPFGYKPVESTNEILADGALELSGMMVGRCKVFWITSQVNGVNTFNANAAVAFNTKQLGAVYQGPTTTMIEGVVNSIVRYATRQNPADEKEMFKFFEYAYLPALTDPYTIFRTIFN